MSHRLLLNLVLVAVVVTLGWLAWRGDGPADGPPPGLPVTGLDPQSVQRMAVQRPDRPEVSLARDDGGWRLLAPLAAPADEFRVRALLGLAAARSAEGFRAAGNDLTQYGLEPPRARVRFDDVEVAVGDAEPVSGLRYVLSDDQVHLIEDAWFGQVFGDSEAWVDPHPLPRDARPVAIRLPDAAWVMEAGRWRREPADPAVSADAGTALADAWQRARALAVRALDPALPWDGTVEIVAGAGDAPLRFAVARIPEAVFLGRRDLAVQYRFLPRQGDTLLGAPER